MARHKHQESTAPAYELIQRHLVQGAFAPTSAKGLSHPFLPSQWVKMNMSGGVTYQLMCDEIDVDFKHKHGSLSSTKPWLFPMNKSNKAKSHHLWKLKNFTHNHRAPRTTPRSRISWALPAQHSGQHKCTGMSRLGPHTADLQSFDWYLQSRHVSLR